MDEDNLEKEGDPPFTLHIGMLFTAICRLVLIIILIIIIIINIIIIIINIIIIIIIVIIITEKSTECYILIRQHRAKTVTCEPCME